jgi:hypothetical protein
MKTKAIVVGLLLCALMVSGAICQSSTSVQYAVTVVGGQGSVSPSSGSAPQGSAVTFTAIPSSGWSFDHWGGDASGSQNPLTLTMNSNKYIMAYFTEGGGDGGGTGGTLQKPKVGYVPTGWYLSADEPYGTYYDAGIEAGLVEYTDDLDLDFVQIYWGDMPSSLVGQESNGNALMSRAEYESIFVPDDTGTMFIAGEMAGYTEIYDPYWNTWEMEIVFVSGATYIDIYTIFNASYWDEMDAMDLIDSIYF